MYGKSQTRSLSARNAAVFGNFKNRYQGQAAVLFGTGPSLNRYQPIEPAIKIGVNSIIRKRDLRMDYLFLQDSLGPTAYNENSQAFDKYTPKGAKFYGCHTEAPHFGPPLDAAQRGSALVYDLDKPHDPVVFEHEIDRFRLGNAFSTIFGAAQFALFTGISTLYIVGCDIGDCEYFDSSKAEEVKTRLFDHGNDPIENWRRFKEFASRYYSEVDIVSINPVSLRGMFRDWDQVASGKSLARKFFRKLRGMFRAS